MTSSSDENDTPIKSPKLENNSTSQTTYRPISSVDFPESKSQSAAGSFSLMDISGHDSKSTSIDGPLSPMDSPKPDRTLPIRRDVGRLLLPEPYQPSNSPSLEKAAVELSTILRENPDGPPSHDNIDHIETTLSNFFGFVSDSKEHLALVEQVLIWLAKIPVNSSNPRIKALFTDLSRKETALTYSAEVAAYLATGRFEQALRSLKDARSSIQEGLYAADSWLAHAFSHHQWDMLLDLHTQFEQADPKDLWARVVALAEFDQHFFALIDRYEKSQEKHIQKTWLRIIERVWAERVDVLVKHEDFQSTNTEVHLVPFRGLFLRVHGHNLPSPRIYNDFLEKSLDVWTIGSPEDFTELITIAYEKYRRSPIFLPYDLILKKMMMFWRERTVAYRGDLPGRHPFTDIDDIVEDIKRFHGLRDGVFATIMEAYARLGDVEKVELYAQRYKSIWGRKVPTLKAKCLWPLIYVHAKLVDPVSAWNRLKTIEQDFGVVPDSRCWDNVMHAYQKADDVKGALDVLDQMLESGVTPSKFAFTNVCTLYAKLGDVESIMTLINAAKAHGIIPDVHLLNCVVIAHVSNDDFESASSSLEEIVQAVEQGEAAGDLTLCFNTVMTAHALYRDIDSAIAVYRRMKDEKIPLDGHTYGALLHVLCQFRRSDFAHKIITAVMRDSNVRPEGFHYAIVMAGYVNQGMYRQALNMAAEMYAARVRPTPATSATLKKAKTLQVHEMTGSDLKYDDGLGRQPLEDAITAFEQWYGLEDQEEGALPAGNSQPSPGLRMRDKGKDAAFLIFIHGKRRSFEAAKSIAEAHMSRVREGGNPDESPSTGLATALMSVHFRERKWELVDKYWDLIMSQADFVRRLHQETRLSRDSSSSDTLDPISPSHRFMLNKPLRYYLLSQFSQDNLTAPSRMSDLVHDLMSDGFQFDTRTWNMLIVGLCRASPPRTLLAFKLMEKFLIPNFPGWVPAVIGVIRNTPIGPKSSALAEGVQYLQNKHNTRYRAFGVLVPQYRTMVYLASALLELRNLEAEGTIRASLWDSGVEQELQDEILDQVGTVAQVMELAPNTWHAVRSMPKVYDRLQQKLIRQ